MPCFALPPSARTRGAIVFSCFASGGSRRLWWLPLLPAMLVADPQCVRGQTANNATSVPPAAALTLAECRRLALANNLALRAQREALVAAGFLARAELGYLEPELVTSIEREANERENTIEQTISQGTSFFEEHNTLFAAGIEGLAPTGARYRVGWSERDLTNNLRLRTTDPLRSEMQGFLGLTLTQPLLKDFGGSATMARLRLARQDEQIAWQEYRRQMMLVLGSVETAYWDLQVAQERQRLRQESVAGAERLLEENRARVREGQMAEIELVEAEAGLAQRRSLASEALQRLFDASGRLKTLFAEPVEGTNWTVRAADTPPAAVPLPPMEELLRAAVELHPEYLARLHRAEQEDVRVAYARNQRWPQVDLKASYGMNGLGSNLAGAWGDIEHRGFDSWSVGLELRVPVLTGLRRGNELRAAEARRRESLLHLKGAEIEIANNLHTAQRRVESLLAVAANYDQVADAGRRLLDSERSRLAEGKTDSRRLLEVESQLADAQIASVESRGEYEKARVELELASGRLLTQRGVDIGPQVAPLAGANAAGN